MRVLRIMSGRVEEGRAIAVRIGFAGKSMKHKIVHAPHHKVLDVVKARHSLPFHAPEIMPQIGGRASVLVTVFNDMPREDSAPSPEYCNA